MSAPCSFPRSSSCSCSCSSSTASSFCLCLRIWTEACSCSSSSSCPSSLSSFSSFSSFSSRSSLASVIAALRSFLSISGPCVKFPSSHSQCTISGKSEWGNGSTCAQFSVERERATLDRHARKQSSAEVAGALPASSTQDRQLCGVSMSAAARARLPRVPLPRPELGDRNKLADMQLAVPVNGVAVEHWLGVGPPFPSHRMAQTLRRHEEAAETPRTAGDGGCAPCDWALRGVSAAS
mmetsp:Transcript_22304/g.49364  ORF Transcript_22304/g.49364 Transcript_22304/m.49364 type:complete len:237 (-) Transcript_22304:681-1391(-)